MADIRILINDKAVGDLKAPSSGQYRARDTQLKGFHVIVGRRSKAFAVQGDLRKDGKRVASILVRIGDAETMSTREARASAKTYLGQISKDEHSNPKASDMLAHANDTLQGNGDEAAQPEIIPRGVTLRHAWARYRDAHLIRKGRSEGTIEVIVTTWSAFSGIGSTSPCRNWRRSGQGNCQARRDHEQEWSVYCEWQHADAAGHL